MALYFEIAQLIAVVPNEAGATSDTEFDFTHVVFYSETLLRNPKVSSAHFFQL